MMNLIHIDQNEQGLLVVNSVDFAQGLGVQHKNLLDTIRTHKAAIEQDFGVVAFQTRKPTDTPNGGRPEAFVLLTEDQALFVGTLSRNSSQVVRFKSVLIRSFAEARKGLQIAPVSTEQVLVHLAQQNSQLLTNQQQQLAQLRADMDSMMRGDKWRSNNTFPPTSLKGKLSTHELRQLITRRVNDYCAYNNGEYPHAYNYLYKRMFEVYGLNVYVLTKQPGEYMIDAIERNGYLPQLHELVHREFIIPDQY